jgi:hypothetical protein
LRIAYGNLFDRYNDLHLREPLFIRSVTMTENSEVK